MRLPSLPRFSRDRGGATSIEYAIIASLITIGLIGAINTWGNAANGMYTNLHNKVWNNS